MFVSVFFHEIFDNWWLSPPKLASFLVSAEQSSNLHVDRRSVLERDSDQKISYTLLTRSLYFSAHQSLMKGGRELTTQANPRSIHRQHKYYLLAKECPWADQATYKFAKEGDGHFNKRFCI